MKTITKQTNKNLGVIYYRVSTSEQAEHGFSLENQKEACLKLGEKDNIEIIKYFSDEGESAKTADRPGLQAMLKFCADKKNKVTHVIVYKIDRLSRNVEDYSTIIGFLQQRNIQLISVTEAISNNSFGKFMGNIMASVAQLDNDVRGERVTEGLQKCLESGRFPYKAPVGYLNVTTPAGSKEIMVDPERGHLVKFVLEEFSKGLHTAEELRQQVNKKGFKTKDGKEASSQLLHKMLVNKFYTGVLVSKAQEYRGSHEPLISGEIYYKNLSLLRKTSKGASIARSRSNESFPLRNFILCCYCFRPLTAAFSKGKLGGRYPYYRCYNTQCTSKKSIAKSKLEDEFTAFLDAITPKQQFLQAFKEVIIDVWQSKYRELSHQTETFNTELRKLRSEKDKVLEMAKRGLLDDNDFKEEFERIKQKITDTQLLLSDNRIEEFNIDETVTYVFNFITTIPEYWRQASYQQRVKLQGLIFPEKPVYTYSEFETQQIALNFEANKQYKGNKSSLVALRGIEPRFGG